MTFLRTSVSSYARIALPALLAALTYCLWWWPKSVEELEPKPLLFLLVAFWATVIASIIALPLLRSHPKLLGIALVPVALALTITSNPVLTVTLWLFQGTLWSSPK